MPITKTAKRALRSSKRKKQINDRIRAKMEIATRALKNKKSKKSAENAFSAIDRAVKANIIHKNKAAKLKSQLTKLFQTKVSKKAN